MNLNRLVVLFSFLSMSLLLQGNLFAQQASGQQERYQITGIVVETTSDTSRTSDRPADGQRANRQQSQRPDGPMGRMPGNPLPGANIALLSAADSSLVLGTTSGQFGLFTLDRVPSGQYILAVTFVGYTTQLIPLTIQGESIPRMVIRMQEGPQLLEELQISALIPRVEVRGDTTAFNADAYQVNRDANAEDLVRRMPGFTIENGRLQAQGEEVQRITLDGEEFFGEDATLALRNLPAEIIGSIEVFDRQSDQARFTGFNDGNEQRTVNIVTRSGRANGQFGRSNVSFGSDNRYMFSGNANYFSGQRRISILGMTNNVNQQNFTSADLEGVAAATQQPGGGGRGMGGGRWGGGGATQNFMTGQQRGINTTHSLGINYIDRLNGSNGRNTRISGSYFFNAGDNQTNQVINRAFTTDVDAGQEYNETAFSETTSANHRFNARIEHTHNSNNSFIFTPNFNLQSSNSNQLQNGRTTDAGLALNSLISSFDAETMNWNFSNSLLWRHRFETRGRTLSMSFRTSGSDRNSTQLQNSESLFFDDRRVEGVSRILSDQSTETETFSLNNNLDIQFTEPLRENLQLLLRLRPGIDIVNSDRNVFNRSLGSTEYLFNPTLTNQFTSQTVSAQAGGGLRYRGDNYNINFDLNYEYNNLEGDQIYPQNTSVSNTYHNLVGSINMQYRFSRTSNLILDYRTNTRNPSVSQLQSVIDNTNPLFLRGGNPNLDQQYSHNLTARFRTANIDAGTSYFGFVRYSLTSNTIGNRTVIASQDMLLPGGVFLGRGGRYTFPDNIGTSWNIRSFFVHSRAVPTLKSNVNFNSGLSYSISPTFNNDLRTEARNIGISGGTSLNSNIGPNLDFNFSYRGNYNIVDNATSLGINSNYYNGNASARINLLAWDKLVVATDMTFTHFEGLDEDFDQQVLYWNASMGYKFLPGNAGELRITVFDILAQNNSVSRFVNDGFVDDISSNVITRFAMVSFNYSFRNFR
jgi:hypothetical protein